MMNLQAIQTAPAFAAVKSGKPTFAGQSIAAQTPIATETPKTDALQLRDALVSRQPRFGGYMPSIVVPTDDGGSVTVDAFTQNFRNNILYFNGPIMDKTALAFNASLNFLQQKILDQRMAAGIENPRDLTPDSEDFNEKRDRITIFLNSYGGQFYSMHSIVDTIERLKNNGIVVSLIGRGMVANEAAIMLAAGTPGYRGITPNTLVQIEQPSGAGQGHVTNLKIRTQLWDQLKNYMATYLADHSNGKKTKEEIEKAFDRAKIMDAEEAVNEFGIADNIVEL